MGRLLFVFPPFFGHLTPAAATARRLVERGHEVAWTGLYGHEDAPSIETLLAGMRVLESGEDPAWTEKIRERYLAGEGDSAASAYRFGWEEIGMPYARKTLPFVRAAVEGFRPDGMVVDSTGTAGALVARETGLPWASSFCTPADWRRELAHLPPIVEWSEGLLREFQLEAGREPVEEFELSPHLRLVYSTREFVGEAWELGDAARLVGPAIDRDAREPIEFPWDRLREGPRVLVSLGSLFGEAGERFFDVVRRALEGAPYQVILVAPDPWERPPENFLVRRWIPQLEVLERVDAVVSHGGYNTTVESLLHGRPLVLLPIGFDQPIVTETVRAAGAGVRLSFRRCEPDTLREAVDEVLEDGSYAESARRIGASFARADGAGRAADLIEDLVFG